ncbi:hypothetical protein [Clostridium beijerinckii]|nr:hypothetical protein [Clostridium beijerinckii]MRY42793.1 hypothetical protein [Parabacteroides distasonis]MZK53632.1 hypothetical protein [Clostridium beijerinckii]MZK61743.1 hypothetical protein [Clostridium beijerinckii]MZK71942.1 hypothetical protein [Clostridium beijerinckii]MZK77329.1 hypothetical protein [Clostridium beijerinckii]
MEKCIEKEEYYSTDEAAQKALEWCDKHEGWKRICDIEDSDSLYKNWDELSDKEKKPWIGYYGEFSAESAWRELEKRPCKVKYGFITGKGEFYNNILKVPKFHNLMQVYKVG